MLEPTDIIDLFFHHLPTKKISIGEVIFQEGDKGNKMFALISGQIELRKNGKLVEIINDHDIFGEGALVQPEHDRFTTAIAKTECQLAELDREKFLFDW